MALVPWLALLPPVAVPDAALCSIYICSCFPNPSLCSLPDVISYRSGYRWDSFPREHVSASQTLMVCMGNMHTGLKCLINTSRALKSIPTVQTFAVTIFTSTSFSLYFSFLLSPFSSFFFSQIRAERDFSPTN